MTDIDAEATTSVGTHVLFENDRLRVFEMILAPGEACLAHRHVHDHLILYAEPARIRALAAGRPVIQHVEDGCVSYRAVGPKGLPPHSITKHEVRIRAQRDQAMLIVEVTDDGIGGLRR